MHIAFLDEFGHIGPYVSRTDRRYRQSPVFGLSGFILPHTAVRGFSTAFYQDKNSLLGPEIKASGHHPATWEKKGIELFTTRNIKKYPEIRQSIFRLLNRIYRCNGRIFYYGREKYQTPEQSHSSGLYTTVMGHTVRQLDRFCDSRNSQFLMILDQHADRLKLLETAAKTMYGADPARHLLEAPFQVESHLYQTIQAADWISAIMGRLHAYRVAPNEYSDWDWTEKFFGTRIDAGVTHSVLWRPRRSAANDAPPQQA